MEQAVQVPVVMVMGTIISIIGFLLLFLIGLVGYFIKQIHNDYKEDRKTYQGDKKTFDDKIERVAEIFAAKLEKVAEKIGGQIDQVKGSVTELTNTVRGLTTALQQVEKDALNRHSDLHKRLDEHHEAIELTRKRIHEQGNQLTPVYIDWERRRKEEELAKITGKEHQFQTNT